MNFELYRKLHLHLYYYPSRDPMLILQDLARFLQKDVNLARSCKILARLTSEFKTPEKKIKMIQSAKFLIQMIIRFVW